MNVKKNKRGNVPDEQRIRDALTKSVNRIQGSGGAAKLLGIPPSTLRKYMRMYGIPLPREQHVGLAFPGENRPLRTPNSD